MTTLRDQVVKLAFDNPGPLRDALLPILSKQAGKVWEGGDGMWIVRLPGGVRKAKLRRLSEREAMKLMATPTYYGKDDRPAPGGSRGETGEVLWWIPAESAPSARIAKQQTEYYRPVWTYDMGMMRNPGVRKSDY